MNERSPVDGSGTHMAWKTTCAGILIEQIHWVDTPSATLLTGPVEGGCNCYQSRKISDSWGPGVVSLCALRWCLREVSNCFISGILPITTITRVRTSRGQILKFVRVLSAFSVGVVHVLILRVHIGGTYGKIAEVPCDWGRVRTTKGVHFIES